MGVELEVSELAVLRPIQTAAATRPPGNDGPDAADTGCVTPTAASSLLPRQLGLDIDAADTGCVTPTAASALLPRQLGLGLDTDAAACVTPTSSPCVLRAATVCPPAPRKPARKAPDVGKRKSCCTSLGLQQRAFFPVPRDLSTVFVPRGGPADVSAAATARSPPQDRNAKKIRLHLVV